MQIEQHSLLPPNATACGKGYRIRYGNSKAFSGHNDHALVSGDSVMESKDSSPRSDLSKVLKTRNLACFPPIPPLYRFSSLSFDGNPIKAFTGFEQHPTLTRLTLNDTLLSSFLDAPVLPKIEWLSLKNTPLSSYPLLPVMAAIIYSPPLQYVNGEPISPRDLRLAHRIRDQAGPLLIEGWILTKATPIRLFHSTRRTRVELPPRPPTKDQITDNSLDGVKDTKSQPAPVRPSPVSRSAGTVKKLGNDTRGTEAIVSQQSPGKRRRTPERTISGRRSIRSILRRPGGPSDAFGRGGVLDSSSETSGDA
jgi:hypothetical protein